MKTTYFRRGPTPRDVCIADVSVFRIGEKTIGLLNRICSSPAMRGRGYARLVMLEVLGDADKERLTMWLEINPYGNMSFEDLEAWYKRLGFKWHNKEKKDYMIRKPRRVNL